MNNIEIAKISNQDQHQEEALDSNSNNWLNSDGKALGHTNETRDGRGTIQ